MKNLIKKIGVWVAVLFVLVGINTAGYATNEYVRGSLYRNGSLTQYDYTRTHTFDGAIYLHVLTMPYGYLRLGLRDMRRGGEQFTPSYHWDYCGPRSWPDIRRGTRFAFQGRMRPGPVGCANVWAGALNY